MGGMRLSQRLKVIQQAEASSSSDDDLDCDPGSWFGCSTKCCKSEVPAAPAPVVTPQPGLSMVSFQKPEGKKPDIVTISNTDKLCRVVESGQLDRLKQQYARCGGEKSCLEELGARGCPCWHHGAGLGFVEITRFCLQEGVHVDSCGRHQRTALMLAAGGNHLMICTDLLRYGASPSLADEFGRTAVVYALHNGAIECASFLRSCRGEQSTVQSDMYGFSHSFYAVTARKQAFEALRWVQRSGAPLDSPDHQGQTPLMALVSRLDCSLDMVKFLLWAQANPAARRDDGVSVLQVSKAEHGLLPPAPLGRSPWKNPMTIDDEDNVTDDPAHRRTQIEAQEQRDFAAKTRRRTCEQHYIGDVVNFLEQCLEKAPWFTGPARVLANFARERLKDPVDRPNLKAKIKLQMMNKEVLLGHFGGTHPDPRKLGFVFEPPEIEPPLHVLLDVLRPDAEGVNEWVHTLVDHKADVTHRDASGHTLLNYVVDRWLQDRDWMDFETQSRKRRKCLEYLTGTLGCSVLDYDTYGRNAVLLACCGDDLKLLDFVITRFEAETEVLGETIVRSRLCRDRCGWGPLHWLCYGGQRELLRFVLDKFGKRAEKEARLLKKKSFPPSESTEAPPPLFIACLACQWETLAIFEQQLVRQRPGLRELFGVGSMEELYQTRDVCGLRLCDYVYRRFPGAIPFDELEEEELEAARTLIAWYKEHHPTKKVSKDGPKANGAEPATDEGIIFSLADSTYAPGDAPGMEALSETKHEQKIRSRRGPHRGPAGGEVYLMSNEPSFAGWASGFPKLKTLHLG